MVKDIIIVLIASFITIFVIIVTFIINDTKNKLVVSTTEFQRPTEKRYVYVILGRIPPFNKIEFKYIESDTKLTYKQLKNKNLNFEIMSINVLDRKTGKF